MEIKLKPKILCLHGYRTSGLILSRQMASMQFHVNAEFIFLDGPNQSTGEPDEGIQTYYPNLKYYEWNSSTNNKRNLSDSINYVIDKIHKCGPIDGILGFSQGACMATHIAYYKETQNDQILNDLKFVILLGGVPPEIDIPQNNFSPISLPSLHIWGEEDFVLESSKLLKNEWYDSQTSSYSTHPGGHHIPTLRSGMYSVINDWIKNQL